MNTTPKVALVTGASSGFGLATAARLSAPSASVCSAPVARLCTTRLPAWNCSRWMSIRRHPFRHASKRSWGARGASICW